MQTPTLLVKTLDIHGDGAGATGARRHAGDVYRTDRGRALELEAAGKVEVLEDVDGVSWQNPNGRILTPLDCVSLYEPASAPGVPPRVLQLTQYDPGSAAYRYHSAFNTAAGGSSAFVRFGNTNPHCDLRQFDGSRHHRHVRRLMHDADVVHVHMDYTTLDDSAPRGVGEWPRKDQLLVRHYHGSEPESASKQPFRADWPRIMQREQDDAVGAVHVGARLYHHRLSERMYWMPIPMPCDDYAALAKRLYVPMDQRTNKRFRIAHSATNPRIKGTMAFQCAVMDLQNAGLEVEAVTIMGMSHREALCVKATCDATFDSFWLGIQGSGLEGAAMRHAVIAGDPDVRDEYVQHIGYCPYTYARGYEEIKPVIERLVVDAEYRAAEAARVGTYTRAYHDYPVVGARYWAMIATERAARGFC